MVKKACGSVLLHNVSPIHKQYTGADLACESHFVCNHNHGHAIVRKLFHDLQHFTDHFRDPVRR